MQTAHPRRWTALAVYQVGSALGLAAMTTLAGAHGADRIGDITALTDGYSAAFLGAAVVAVAGAALAAVLLRAPEAETIESQHVTETGEHVIA